MTRSLLRASVVPTVAATAALVGAVPALAPAAGAPAAGSPSTGETDTTARWLGGAGLLLGALGLGVGGGAVLRTRRTTGTGTGR